MHWETRVFHEMSLMKLSSGAALDIYSSNWIKVSNSFPSLVSKENRVKIKKEPALQKKGIVFVFSQEQQKEHGGDSCDGINQNNYLFFFTLMLLTVSANLIERISAIFSSENLTMWFPSSFISYIWLLRTLQNTLGLHSDLSQLALQRKRLRN